MLMDPAPSRPRHRVTRTRTLHARRRRPSKDDVLGAIEGMDADGDNKVSWGEFRAAALGEEPEPSEPAAEPDIEAYLRAIFDRNDADGSGEISTRKPSPP